jgi:hypothetical protein
MKFDFTELGFTFELPEGWHRSEHMINPSFIGTIFLVSDRGLILLMPGEVKDELVDNEARKKALRQEFQAQGATNLHFSSKPVYLGDEGNVVYAEFDLGPKRACAISAVHGGFLVEIRFDGDLRDPNYKAVVQQLMSSFEFVTPSKPIRFVPMEEARLPSPLHDGLTAQSPEEAREMLTKCGSPPLVQGPGYTIHKLKSESDIGEPQHDYQMPTKAKKISVQKVSELDKLLDNPNKEDRRRAEDQLVALLEEAVDQLLDSIDRINRLLLQRDNPEANMAALERRIRILEKIGSPRAVKAIIDAVADSAGTVEVLRQQINETYDHPDPFYRHDILLLASGRQVVAESLRDSAVNALAAIGKPALPLIHSSISKASRPAQKALRRAASRIQKKWWQFWK